MLEDFLLLNDLAVLELDEAASALTVLEESLTDPHAEDTSWVVPVDLSPVAWVMVRVAF